MSKSNKSLEEMKAQELVERMNKIRDTKNYAIQKGYNTMITQLDAELDKAQEQYEIVITREKEEFEEMLEERKRAKIRNYQPKEENDSPVVFETTENKKDDD